MNLDQVKKDRDGGVMICRETWDKVLDAALLMERSLLAIQLVPEDLDGSNVAKAHAIAEESIFLVNVL